ncbi:ubiquitin-conjugating enzyme E2 [Tautonia plasticadhaerens]|uniref:Ubiquitin-conjugating enzyme n=1 Tax=Tautonia plasticadhaerens TaxID=2527974 RepID=A0A518GVT7_9BACT|nr:ubiquitin-conjugating enzyme E2 [Tautonia plasticadhaerens]QDV32678.1 Ubiquitin-conjugating enzyme [Tautonia plasticadhaerens]
MLRKSYDSPQARRLRSDRSAMERLSEESTIFRFRASGDPTQRYLIEFHGRSLARERGKIVPLDTHQVEVKLGASYPRTMPELRWLSPIYHPNISEIGLVCLGGYNTHWVPSLQLDELCEMLWDMARFHNYDLRSPYNRDAAIWAASQSSFAFPMDPRPLRDLRASKGRTDPEPIPLATPIEPASLAPDEPIILFDAEVSLPPRREQSGPRPEPPPDVIFID